MRPSADKLAGGTTSSGTRLLPRGHGNQVVVAPDGNEIAVGASSWLVLGRLRPRMQVLVVTTATRPSPLPPSCLAHPRTCGTTNGFSPVGCPAAVRRN